jgi:hypothetical protein
MGSYFAESMELSASDRGMLLLCLVHVVPPV